MPLTYTLKITLRDTKPPVWRRVTVPATCSFADLHLVLQVAMGWDDSHLWEFWDGGRGLSSVRLGPIPSGETADTWFDADDQRDAATVHLPEVLTAVGQKLLYTYDMGDNWEHQVLVEAIAEVPEGAPSAALRCLAGKRACPPEDCGGIGGYYQILELLETKQPLPEHLDYLADYDPAAFDGAAVNEDLAKRIPWL